MCSGFDHPRQQTDCSKSPLMNRPFQIAFDWLTVEGDISHAPGDEEVRRFVTERSKFWRSKLIARMERASTDEDFASTYDARSLALTLKAATDGLLVAAGSGASESDLRGIADSFLRMWPSR